MIREVLTTSPFHSEGHRKVRVRLRQRGVRVGKARVLRLMRVHGLLAPTRPGHVHGDPAHAGRITTDRPDELWGTDATCFWTEQDGWCWFFGAIDHGTDELVGWKATKRGDRWAALEPLYQGVRYAFGGVRKDIARGLTVRTDWGPQYTAHAFGAELRWLGIQHSPSFVGEPQCNGVIERFMRTLKEQCLSLLTACGPREDAGGGVIGTENCPGNPDRYNPHLAAGPASSARAPGWSGWRDGPA